DAPSNLAIAARYVLSPAIFDALARTRRGKGGEIQLTDGIRALIAGGGSAWGVRLRPGERRYDIGNFQAYFEAFVEFALADPKFGPELRRYLEDLLMTEQKVVPDDRAEPGAGGSREREGASETSGGGAPRALENGEAWQTRGGGTRQP